MSPPVRLSVVWLVCHIFKFYFPCNDRKIKSNGMSSSRIRFLRSLDPEYGRWYYQSKRKQALRGSDQRSASCQIGWTDKEGCIGRFASDKELNLIAIRIRVHIMIRTYQIRNADPGSVFPGGWIRIFSKF